MKESNEQAKHSYHYNSKLTRRESLKWFGALSVSSLLPVMTGCDFSSKQHPITNKIAQGHWPNLTLMPISAKGYGKDPSLVILPRTPWPKTLSGQQLSLVATLSDILVPREGQVPSAAEVGVPDVVDEWLSAPYERQQQDRLTILSLLTWIDDESLLRYSRVFQQLSKQEQLAIIDDIAYSESNAKKEFLQAAMAFTGFRKLVLAAFFSSPAGTKDIGYQGGVAIAGDYPGPTDEAMRHLNSVLTELGLSL